MAWGILPATVKSPSVTRISTSHRACPLTKRFKRRGESEGKAGQKQWRDKEAYLQQLCFWTPLVFPDVLNNLLTEKCYTLVQLSGLIWPHVPSEVNFVLMSMALSSTRCSALWLNTCYPLWFLNACPLHLYFHWTRTEIELSQVKNRSDQEEKLKLYKEGKLSLGHKN